MKKNVRKLPWQDKVCNPAQLGGIETSVLDDGPGRGTRVAWVNTGSGLRYKVAIDRGMDIVEAFYNEHSLAWLSHGGLTASRPDANQGLEWLYTFPGGLLTTCGLSHVGGPETDEFGSRGLHGRVSNLPAAVEVIIQPELAAARLDFGIAGVVKESRVFGPCLELRRSICGRLGEGAIYVHDVVTNCGSQSVPHMLLYHCNFGYPLVDEGTEILWRGVCQSRGLAMDNAIFKDGADYRRCRRPLAAHRGGGEACGFIDARADRAGMVTAGLHNRKLGLALMLRYRKKEFPCLANWQHWGIGDYVTALEPGTNFPIGQGAARRQKKLIFLEPGESRTYQLEMHVLTAKRDIREFVAAVAGQ